MRLAHFSDIHVTLSPLSQPPAALMGKRVAGMMNYYFGGRQRHFHDVEARISRLLNDVDAQSVDHAVCTGDITAMSYDEEFQHCAAAFGDRMKAPQKYTVLPGNHDRYTTESVEARAFEKAFAPLCANEFPFKKSIAPGVTLIGLDVSRPTSMLDSSGMTGERQLKALKDMVTDASLKDQFVIVTLHYGLLRENGQPDHASHMLRDYLQLIDIIDDENARVDLVLHGHTHRPFQARTKRRSIVCAGSATDLHQKQCGYFVYDIDVDKRTFQATRRVWDAGALGYK